MLNTTGLLYITDLFAEKNTWIATILWRGNERDVLPEMEWSMVEDSALPHREELASNKFSMRWTDIFVSNCISLLL